MNDEDVVLFHRAEALVNSGQKYAAHEMFCMLAERNEEIEVLFWVATTSADAADARRTIDIIKRKAPYHPRLKELEAFHNRKLQATYTPSTPALFCPYCGVRAPALVKRKISVGGWIWFAAFFLLFLGCMFTLVPVSQLPTMGKEGFFFLIVGILGLFIIRKRSYICGHCGSHITAAG